MCFFFINPNYKSFDTEINTFVRLNYTKLLWLHYIYVAIIRIFYTLIAYYIAYCN